MKSLILLFVLFLVSYAVAQEEPADVEGCKDLPMFTRMPHTYIVECSENFNQLDIPIGNGEVKTLEGTKAYIGYTYDYTSGVKPPSFFQIVRNYENALKKFGGKKIYYDGAYGTLFVHADGKDVWIIVTDFSGIGEGQFSLTTLTVEPMKQEISANVILDELTTKGFVALYINFETGKSAIKPESQPIIDAVAAMLRDNPSLRVSIEGHTDNVGSAAANKKLSEERAAAVLASLSTAGIEKSRMQSKGFGQEVPVADNRSEEGRAQNRRVEIVKLP